MEMTHRYQENLFRFTFCRGWLQWDAQSYRRISLVKQMTCIYTGSASLTSLFILLTGQLIPMAVKG